MQCEDTDWRICAMRIHHPGCLNYADTYGHLIPGGIQQAVDKLDAQQNGLRTVSKTVTEAQTPS